MKCDICGHAEKQEIRKKVVSRETFVECIKLIECTGNLVAEINARKFPRQHVKRNTMKSTPNIKLHL